MESDDECPPDLVLAPAEQQDVMPSEQPSRGPGAVPVTILTGFLGAGKTTLLNYILTQDHGRRIAVIENEVGDSMDIEALIARDGADGSMLEDNLFELKNGCICCTVKDDLVTTLETLLQRRNKFDYIIIETTGLANPGPVASVFWLDDALESALRLDAIITLVDAKNIRRQLQRTASSSSLEATRGSDTSERIGPDRGADAATAEENGEVVEKNDTTIHRNEAAIQLAHADRILVNKTDLVSPEDLEHVMTQVRQINAVAQLHCTQRSMVDLSWVLDTKCFSLEWALAVDPGLAVTSKGSQSAQNNDGMAAETFPQEEVEAGRRESGGDSASRVPSGHVKHQNGYSNNHGNGESHDPHGEDCAECVSARKEGSCSVHDVAVTTHSVELAGSLEIARLERWLGGLLWDPSAGGTEVYRVKGVVSVQGRAERFVVQGVADLFEVAPAGMAGSAWREGEPRHCKMVFIGRHLSKDALERGILSCMV